MADTDLRGKPDPMRSRSHKRSRSSSLSPHSYREPSTKRIAITSSLDGLSPVPVEIRVSKISHTLELLDLCDNDIFCVLSLLPKLDLMTCALVCTRYELSQSLAHSFLRFLTIVEQCSTWNKLTVTDTGTLAERLNFRRYNHVQEIVLAQAGNSVCSPLRIPSSIGSSLKRFDLFFHRGTSPRKMCYCLSSMTVLSSLK